MIEMRILFGGNEKPLSETFECDMIGVMFWKVHSVKRPGTVGMFCFCLWKKEYSYICI